MKQQIKSDPAVVKKNNKYISTELLEILVISLLSFTLSAVLLSGAFIFYSSTIHNVDADLQPWQVRNLRTGEATRVNLDTKKYAILEYKLSDADSDAALILFWLTTANPRKFYKMVLPKSQAGRGAVALWKLRRWTGIVTRLGVAKIHPNDESQSVEEIVISPYTTSGMIKVVRTDWMSTYDRSHRTINFVTAAPSNSLVHLVPTLAAWAGLSLVISVLLSRLYGKRWNYKFIIIFILSTWLVLDVRWQILLWDQLLDTKNQYAGRTWAEKNRLGKDAGLYAYIERLKETVLPATPSRIFVLRKKFRWGHEYQRLRTQYFLLPHNVFNFGDEPREEAMREGDYVLVLGDITGMGYTKDTGRLYWSGDKSVSATLIDQDPLATLYRIHSPRQGNPL